MKVKRLELQGLRCFRGRTVLDFTDPATGKPQDIVVMIGSNGSGKTTVLDSIEALLWRFIPVGKPHHVFGDARLAALTLQIPPDEAGARDEMEALVAHGQSDVVDEAAADVSHYAVARWRDDPSKTERLVKDLALAEVRARSGGESRRGGVVYFPSQRAIRPLKGGPIEAPSTGWQWVYRYHADVGWDSSLEQQWVWLNYLDLERRDRNETADEFPRAMELLRQALGRDREVYVKEGRVWVETSWRANGKSGAVLLDQLPSGEQQCAILLGELALQRRRGGIVLIDEPELSLHPAMQRQLVAMLRDYGRSYDCQIILATHSPEVADCVPPHQVISLDYPDYRFGGVDPPDGDEYEPVP